MKRRFFVLLSCVALAVASVGAVVGRSASPQEKRVAVGPFARLGGEAGGGVGGVGRRIFDAPRSTPFAEAATEVGAAESVESVAIGGGFEWEIEFGVGSADEFPLASAPEAAAETALSPCCSVWARFAPGSWARLRTTGVAYENGRAIQSVTETRIALKSVDLAKKCYELQYDATIKMGGVDYPRESETARFDFWDVPLDGDVAIETLAPVNLLIARRAIPCQTRRVVRTTPNGKETTTVWFSPVVAPYVLQKETVRESATGENAAAPRSRELSVVRKTAAHLLLGGALASYDALSTARKGRLVDTKSTVYSTTIPGGIVRETTTETDESGAVLYRATTVLLDYYAAP